MEPFQLKVYPPGVWRAILGNRTSLFLLDRINPAMRGAGMDFQDNFFVCIFNFRTKLKIPNRFAKGEGNGVKMNRMTGWKAHMARRMEQRTGIKGRFRLPKCIFIVFLDYLIFCYQGVSAYCRLRSNNAIKRISCP